MMKKILIVLLVTLTLFAGCDNGTTETHDPFKAITLTVNNWADGNIPESDGAQWFKFTATSIVHFLHVNFSTLTDMCIQLYDGSGTNTIGSEIRLYVGNKNTFWIDFTIGQKYYIKVWPFSATDSGKYQIAFNTIIIPPPVKLPSSATRLTANVWADGDISTSSGAQWFKFNATAASQYVHADFGSLSDLNIQLYDNGGNTVGSHTNLYSSGTRYTSRSLTEGGEYYIKVWPYSSTGRGTYQIAFNASTTTPPIGLPASATQLTVDIWTDGDVPTSSDVQWFKFTATATTQYVHADFGTLSNMYVQLYDNGGNAVGSTANLSGITKYASRPLTNGQEYYIRVLPYNVTYSGTYQIAFSTSSTAPAFKAPSYAITLTASVWTDGNIPTSGGAQWFKFIATAATQYIHADFGTLNDLYVQLYDAGGNAVGDRTNLYSSTKYISRPVTEGGEYYIKVSPFSSGSGTYQIAFNTMPIMPKNVTVLTANTWADGNITASGQQWFKFTATAATQYIHADFGTLSSMYVQLYDTSGGTVGTQANLSGSTKYASRSLTEGEEYYVKVSPYSSTGSGTYQIAFNASSTTPNITLPSNPTTLVAGVWADGNISTAGGQHWFNFTATAATQYIHVDFDTLNDLNIQVYNSDGSTVGNQTNLYGSNRYASRSSLSDGGEYYIKLWPFSSTDSGTYKIAFNTSSTAPGVTLPSNPTTLVAGVWTDGNISAPGGQQWFKFTATAATHYIHADFGTLSNMYIQLYDNDGFAVGSQTNLYGSTKYASRSLTEGGEYYIKIWPYSSTGSGTYQIAFNTSSTEPGVTLPSNPTLLVSGVWTDGDIPTSSDVQWFKFTATATTHYIHTDFGTFSNMYVQLYDNGGGAVGSTANLSGSTKYASRSSLTDGGEYYIKVSSSTGSGTYQIAFNTSSTAPAFKAPSYATTLTAGVWANGNIPTSGGAQWFKFTATANPQYIHADFVTLNDMYVQLYDASDNAVGDRTNLYGSTRNVFRTVTEGQDYYIKVWPYYSTGNGTYKIAFNTSSTAPLSP
jgi:predicted RNA-binding protein with TRAM domain